MSLSSSSRLGQRLEVQIPPYLTDADEFPHEVRDVPLWSENYLCQAYDPTQEIGFYSHLSRSPFDPLVWHENFVLYLPGDRFLVARGYGTRVDPRIPSGGALSWECVDPYQEWRIRFDGGVQLVTGEELLAGPLTEGLHIGASLDLTARARSHVYDAANMKVASWGHMHYEQHHDYTGQIRWGDETIEFNGTGLRDHSLGPRDLSRMGPTLWHSGQFPSGRVFTVMLIPYRTGGEQRHCFIGDRDGVRPAALLNSPLINDASEIYDDYEMHLEELDGRRHLIRAKILQAMPFSLLGANEIANGNHGGADSSHLLFDCQARYEWDGEVGYGLTERSVAHPLPHEQARS